MKVICATAILGLLLITAGCKGPGRHDEARQVAKKRFDHQKAKAHYLLAVEQFDNGQIKKARESAQEAISLYSDDPAYFLLLAKIHLEEGRLARARESLQAVNAEGPVSAEYHYLSGLLSERQGHEVDALVAYKNAHESDSANIEYLLAYAELYVSLNRPREALALIDRRIFDFDGQGRLHALRGEILQMMGRYSAAADAYKDAVIERPKDDLLRESYGIALYWAKRYHDAIVPLRTLYNNMGALMSTAAQSALAQSYFETEDYAAAHNHAEQITRNQPRDAQGWMLRARCELALNQLSDARRAAHKVLEIDPARSDAQVVLGYVYWHQHDLPAAQRVLENALHAQPDDITTLCLLGQVHGASGQPERAIEFYQRALQIAPDDALARHLYEVALTADAGQHPAGGAQDAT